MPSNGVEQAHEIPKIPQTEILNGNEENPWVNTFDDMYGPQAHVPRVAYDAYSTQSFSANDQYVVPVREGIDCSKENVAAARQLAAQAQKAMDYVEMQTSFVEFGGKLADLPSAVREAGLAREDAAVEKMKDLISLTPYEDINSVLFFANDGLEDMGMHFAFERETGVVALMEDDQLLWDLAKSDRME